MELLLLLWVGFSAADFASWVCDRDGPFFGTIDLFRCICGRGYNENFVRFYIFLFLFVEEFNESWAVDDH